MASGVYLNLARVNDGGGTACDSFSAGPVSSTPASFGLIGGALKRPPKTPDRVYPVVKNQEYDRVYDWEYRPG
jgi:hypothetical protein